MKKFIVCIIFLIMMFTTASLAYWFSGDLGSNTSSEQDINIGNWDPNLSGYDYGVANHASLYINIITMDMIGDYDVKGGNTRFILLEDIKLGNLPVALRPLEGTLFGNNLNVTYESISKNSIALFSKINGEVDSLSLKDIYIKFHPLSNQVATLALENSGTISNVKVINSTINSQGDLIKERTNNLVIGGLVATNTIGTIKNVDVSCNINISHTNLNQNLESQVGGVVGEVTKDSIMTNIHFKGNIITKYKIGKGKLYLNIGGLIGHSGDNKLDLTRSTAIGEIKSEITEQENLSEKKSYNIINLGGILGNNNATLDYEVQIMNCFSLVTIDFDSSKLVNTLVDTDIGGLVGEFIGKIINCYSYSPNINSKLKNNGLNKLTVGGLVGSSRFSSSTNFYISNSFAAITNVFVAGAPISTEIMYKEIIGNTFIGDQGLTNTYATNSNVSGIKVSEKQVDIKDISFLMENKLNWDTSVWLIEPGKFPKLK